MGENYYYYFDICPHCGRHEEIHIGKQSAGWKFIFDGSEASKNIHAVIELKAFIRDNPGQIVDEYGTVHPPDKFFEDVDAHQGKRSHRTPEANNPAFFDPSQYWQDDQGYEFTSYTFS